MLNFLSDILLLAIHVGKLYALVLLDLHVGGLRHGRPLYTVLLRRLDISFGMKGTVVPNVFDWY